MKKCVVSYNKYDKRSFTRVHIAVSVHILYKSKKEGSITEDLLQRSKERPSTSQRKSALLEQIEAYVDAHLTEKLTLRVISTQTGVSVSTVTQLFQKKVSTTFHDFVTQRRLEMAKKMIEEGMPLEQVGKEVGYRDHSTFYRAFRRYTGCSPREYRTKLTVEQNF